MIDNLDVAINMAKQSKYKVTTYIFDTDEVMFVGRNENVMALYTDIVSNEIDGIYYLKHKVKLPKCGLCGIIVTKHGKPLLLDSRGVAIRLNR